MATFVETGQFSSWQNQETSRELEDTHWKFCPLKLQRLRPSSMTSLVNFKATSQKEPITSRTLCLTNQLIGRSASTAGPEQPFEVTFWTEEAPVLP
jgi:hypothetical protein